ncbi:nucleotide exchange factor GrpE [Pseudanabaena sp. PCC 6802]|uniref:nucleotide exchange factor GrpE n=1 Tax=Pseudanabaena sp. PCC 6802 TaxID=118173 RepID=UPI000348A99B|nr:nucleotide exchange factor GrpE [Pseudanabaena sp. PCC 6802]
MIDRQALFEKFLAALETPPPLPEYLGEPPTSVMDFDPYQMVAEWIALRHELKQQGKLFQASQNTMQVALAELQAQKSDLQQQLANSRSQEVSQSDRKALWRDLIGVVDALDRACSHWQEQIASLDRDLTDAANHPQPFWQKWLQPATSSVPSSLSDVRDVLVSDLQGIDLIRRSLLDVLRERQVVPIAAQGKPFDPKHMYAISRQIAPGFPENTVIQEVVRGYMWESQVLREAQVIVATEQG